MCRSEGASGIIASPLTAFVRAGHTGVSLFFILSGFLLSLPFLKEAAGGRRLLFREYFSRRALRILPLYYVAVCVGSVLSAAAPRDVLRGLPYLVFLNSADGFYTPLLPYSSDWWSLATEVQFYLLLPLLPLCLRSPRLRWVGAAVLLTYFAAYAGFLRGLVRAQTIDGQNHLCLSVFGRGPFFVLGALAAWLFLHYGQQISDRLSRSAWLRRGGADLLLLLTLTALGILLRWAAFAGFWGVEIREFHVWHVAEGIFWTIVLLLLLLAPLHTKPLFSNRALATLGILSYSIYLVHHSLYRLAMDALRAAYPSVFGSGWTLPTIAAVVLLSTLCLLVSALTYRLIERPFLARKARLDA